METELQHRLFAGTILSVKATVLLQHGMLAALLVASLLVSLGCSSSKSIPDENDRTTRAVLGVLSDFYGDYLESHRGKPPKDNADFHRYLESRAEDLKLFNVESPDELYTSRRDGRPLVIVSGKVIAPPESPESPWAAFEQKGIDGKRYGVRVRGGIHELSDDEFFQIFEEKSE